MNWDAVGAVGEILVAAAVVVSLIYLAAQIRNQNRESRLSAMLEISGSSRGCQRYGSRLPQEVAMRS
jgi:hypothetical protein